MPGPVTFCRMKPSPPKIPAVNDCWKPAEIWMREVEVEQPSGVAGQVRRIERDAVQQRLEICFERRVEESFLAAEVRVDQLLVRAGARREPVNAGTRKPALGEFRRCGFEDAGLRCG